MREKTKERETEWLEGRRVALLVQKQQNIG